jgi:outer membrane murein-binding lipoprotein Lpp
MQRKTLGSILVLLLMLTLVAGCGRKVKTTPRPTTDPTITSELAKIGRGMTTLDRKVESVGEEVKGIKKEVGEIKEDQTKVRGEFNSAAVRMDESIRNHVERMHGSPSTSSGGGSSGSSGSNAPPLDPIGEVVRQIEMLNRLREALRDPRSDEDRRRAEELASQVSQLQEEVDRLKQQQRATAKVANKANNAALHQQQDYQRDRQTFHEDHNRFDRNSTHWESVYGPRANPGRRIGYSWGSTGGYPGR